HSPAVAPTLRYQQRAGRARYEFVRSPRGEREMKSVITCAIALTALIAFASPAKAQGCSIEGELYSCGFVWNDANGNGIQDDDQDSSDEIDTSALDGVPVTLYMKTSSGGWDLVGTGATSGGGIYAFPLLCP